MDEPFLRFEWPVAAKYHWQDWLDERGNSVVLPEDGLLGLDSASAVEHTWQNLDKKQQKTGPVLGPVPTAGIGRTYTPMSRAHASLFRTFADVDYTDRAAIFDFASKYGLLGLPLQDQAIVVSRRTGQNRYHHASGESHLDWAREICLMREALELTTARTAAEQESERLAWARYGLEPPVGERRNKLAWLFNVHLQRVQARMHVEGDGTPRLSFAPLTLLAAMWLQLALSVVGGKEFRACKLCRRLFEISTEQTGYRKHREFCSESCKTKDYRKRKRTALQLAAEGKSAAAISAATYTNTRTIRTWLAAARK